MHSTQVRPYCHRTPLLPGKMGGRESSGGVAEQFRAMREGKSQFHTGLHAAHSGFDAA
jgi:hypothetical protein